MVESEFLLDPTKPLKCARSGLRLNWDFAGSHVKTAIEAHDECWSYRELQEASCRLSKYLQRLNPGQERTVCILGSRTPNLVISLLGAVLAGTPFVILDPAFPLKRLLGCLQLARPFALVQFSKDPLLPELESAFRSLNGVSAIINLPQGKEALLAYLRARSGAALDLLSPQASDPDDLLYIAFTSGTTGTPKAVLGQHGPVSHFLSWQTRRFVLASKDRVSMLSGLGHDPLLRDILMPLSIGATICVPPAECYTVPNHLFDWMHKANITVCHLTPSLATLLMAGSRVRGSRAIPALRYAFFGGEPLRYSLAKKFKDLAPNATIVNCYGATETPQVAGFHVIESGELEGASTGKLETVPIGSGIDDVQLLVQAEDDRLCTAGEIGEIVIRSPFLAREIWDGDGQLVQTFRNNPHTSDPADLVYPTGDYGFYTSTGAVAFVGRRDKQVKIRGHRLQLEELEHLLASRTEVMSYHIDLLQRGELGNSLILYVVAVPDRILDVVALKRAIEDCLPAYMVPDRIVEMPEFPITPNGKVDVEKLRCALSGSSAMKALEPNSADSLSRILAICSRELGLLSLGADDSVLASGLDSLRSIMLLCSIDEAFGVRLGIEELLECETPRRIAERVSCFQLQPSVTRSFGEIASTQLSNRDGLDEANDDTGASSVKTGQLSRLFPKNENLAVGLRNRVLQVIARIAPDLVRVKCHKWRGVSIGTGVSIGYDTVIETSYPWLVKIGDYVNIGMRGTIIAHFRGMTSTGHAGYSVEIENCAFIGPGVILLPNVKIGMGAVIAAGSVVNSSIPPMVLAQGNPAVPIARCGVPLAGSTSYAKFLRSLRPL
jgi:amino acid adenylation domain-containing protein